MLPYENDLSAIIDCSTENEDWKSNTDKLLERNGVFYIQVPPVLMSALPENALVGVGSHGRERDHIVVARVKHSGGWHGFEVEFDPAGKLKKGTPIESCERITLFCRLMK